MFYNKEVKLYRLEAIENEWGVIEEEKYIYIKSLMADIQPYSQDKLNRDYGYDLQTTKRMFSIIDPEINESTLVTYRDKPFHIVKIVEWDDYLDIALDDAVGVDIIG